MMSSFAGDFFTDESFLQGFTLKIREAAFTNCKCFHAFSNVTARGQAAKLKAVVIQGLKSLKCVHILESVINSFLNDVLFTQLLLIRMFIFTTNPITMKAC